MNTYNLDFYSLSIDGNELDLTVKKLDTNKYVCRFLSKSFIFTYKSLGFVFQLDEFYFKINPENIDNIPIDLARKIIEALTGNSFNILIPPVKSISVNDL